MVHHAAALASAPTTSVLAAAGGTELTGLAGWVVSVIESLGPVGSACSSRWRTSSRRSRPR
ncbi:hypothetical protein [Cellulomonas sp. JZ18]|uniref:hypothetical protein n=1 Tax=Cellulomonas sp. JZ18 TaxID=2654191 RepID=UPI001E3226CF|nr:hypothetical protein [Cellulomonas sp. JZ18]